jgi:hypothetical protein
MVPPASIVGALKLGERAVGVTDERTRDAADTGYSETRSTTARWYARSAAGSANRSLATGSHIVRTCASSTLRVR